MPIPKFIKRIGIPEYIDNKDGTYSTHKLAVISTDDRHYVYPMIQKLGNHLVDFSNNSLKDRSGYRTFYPINIDYTKPDFINAFDQALKDKNYLIFNNLDEAIKYTETYKNDYPELLDKESLSKPYLFNIFNINKYRK